MIRLLALLVSSACASAPPRADAERGSVRIAPAGVVFDLASSCPRVAVDRAGRLFSVTMNDGGAPANGGATELVIATQGRATGAWHRELAGRPLHFALADAHLGEGVAVAGAASEPFRLLDETTRGRGMVVVSLAADGTPRFTRRIKALGGAKASDVPRVTALVLGPRSEVTVAGTTGEALDFGTTSLPRDEGARDDTMVFVAQYSPEGVLVFNAPRKAKLGTVPRLAASSDGTVAVAFDTRDGKPAVEWLDRQGRGAPVPLALAGSLRAMATAGRDDVVVATQRLDETTHAPVLQLARLTRRGEALLSITMPGELQDGALAVRANGDLWFGAWFESVPAGCGSPPSPPDARGPLPRLQILSADGRRCRSFPVATRDARWTTPASLLEGARGRMLYATPYLGTVDLPGVPPRSSGMAASRCALFDLPADAPAYTRDAECSEAAWIAADPMSWRHCVDGLRKTPILERRRLRRAAQVPRTLPIFVGPSVGDEFNTVRVALVAVACWRATCQPGKPGIGPRRRR